MAQEKPLGIFFRLLLITMIVFVILAALAGVFLEVNAICVWPGVAGNNGQCPLELDIGDEHLRLLLGGVALAGVLLLLLRIKSDAVAGFGVIALAAIALGSLWPQEIYTFAGNEVGRGYAAAAAKAQFIKISETEGEDAELKFPNAKSSNGQVVLQGGYGAVKFRATANKEVIIGVSPSDPDGDPVAELYKVTRNKTGDGLGLDFLQYDDDGGVDLASELRVQLEKDTTYLLGVMKAGRRGVLQTGIAYDISIKEYSLEDLLTRLNIDDSRKYKFSAFDSAIASTITNCEQAYCAQFSGLVQESRTNSDDNRYYFDLSDINGNSCVHVKATTTTGNARLRIRLADAENNTLNIRDMRDNDSTADTDAENSNDNNETNNESSRQPPQSLEMRGSFSEQEAGAILEVGSWQNNTTYELIVRLGPSDSCAD